MKKLVISLFLGFSLSLAHAQQSVSIGTTDTKTNAVLYLKGDGNQGLIIPVTANHDNVPKTEGMIVYDKSDGKIYKCDGTTWTSVEGGGSVAIAAGTQVGQLLMWDGSKWVPSSTNVPTTTGQVLKWNNTTKIWEAGTDNGTAYTAGTGITITSNTVTNTGDTDATNDITTSSTVTGGELTGTFPSLTIAPGAVTSAKIAGGAVGLTQLANGPSNNVLTTNAGGTPTWSPGGSGVTSVTASGPLATSGTTAAPVVNFPTWPTLNAAGALTNNGSGTLSWQVPTMSGTASGDLTGTYPNPTIANGVITSGKITDGTITGADLAANISVSTSGTITAGSISGAGSGITAINATNITTGTLPIARGGTGLATVPTNGQVLIGNGASSYTLSTLTAGSGIGITNTAGVLTISNTGSASNLDALTDAAVTAPASGQVLLYNGTTDFQNRSLSGDVSSITSTGTVTLSNSLSTRTNLGLGSFATVNNPLSTTGDIIFGTASTPTSLPIGTAGQVLTVFGGLPKWQAAPGFANPMSNPNEMIIGGASGAATTLGVPAVSQVLISNAGGNIVWAPQSNFVSANLFQGPNTVFAAPNGVAGAPVFRTLVDADIAGTAAIAGSKINPAFVAQNISTTGTLAAGATTVTNLTASGTTTVATLTASGTTTFNTKTYTWPNAVAGVGTFLGNDGTGNLSWGTPGSFTSVNVIPKGSAGGLVASQIFDNGTQVGIGTVSPTQLLDVNGGNINTSKDYMINNISVLKSGGSNVAVGGSTPAVSVGTNNTLVGISAGAPMTSGANSNTFVGFNAGFKTTSGASNTFIGSAAGSSHLTGTFNTVIGAGAGLNVTTGTQNIIIGNGADVAAGSIGAIAIGHNALANANNTMALGGTGVDAVNVGIATLMAPTERLDVAGNVKFSGALMPNNIPGTPGQVLTSTGGTTAPTWTTPSGGGFSTTNTIPKGNGTTLAASQIFDDGTNVGIGTVSPAQSLDVGAGNINVRTGNYMIGGTTVLNNTGGNNIFVGAFAGVVNASTANSFVGTAAGQANTSGSNNTFVGSTAGRVNTTASDNTFIGQSAGRSNDIGTQNTFIGSGSAQSNTSGSDNTFLGRGAGISNTGGSKNILIGSNADVGAPNLTNAIAIGANATVGASNSLVLGSGVNVGIGTSTPTSKLQVSGGDIDVTTGGVTSSGTTGAGVNMLPIAYLTVISGALGSKTTNVIALSHAASSGQYDITISGENFSTISNYIVMITLLRPAGAAAPAVVSRIIGSSGTNLQILTYNSTGASLVDTDLSVVIYKP